MSNVGLDPRSLIRAAEPSGPSARRWPALAVVATLLWSLGLALLVCYLWFYLAHATELIVYPYDIDQGEGYDVNSGWLLAQGRPIYTDNSVYPYYSSNYPPVFSLLLAPIVAETGPVLGAGRGLSAAAALLTAATIAIVVHRRGAGLVAGATAGLFYLGSSYVYHVTPLARVNALAALFALVGLYCCMRADDRPTRPSSFVRRSSALGRGWLVGAVVAFLLALFTKQTTLDAVAAGLLFLLWRDTRAGLVAGVTVGRSGWRC